jgi:hypothetical protein
MFKTIADRNRFRRPFTWRNCVSAWAAGPIFAVTSSIGICRQIVSDAEPRARFRWLLLGLIAASAVNAIGFDTPEDAVRALEQAYIQKNADDAVAALDFVEEGRQMLQETNPALANDAETIKQTADGLERSFRDELRTKGFPDFGKLKCSFVGKVQISQGLIKLIEQCVFPDGSKSEQNLTVMKRDVGWRVVLMSPIF